MLGHSSTALTDKCTVFCSSHEFGSSRKQVWDFSDAHSALGYFSSYSWLFTTANVQSSMWDNNNNKDQEVNAFDAENDGTQCSNAQRGKQMCTMIWLYLGDKMTIDVSLFSCEFEFWLSFRAKLKWCCVCVNHFHNWEFICADFYFFLFPPTGKQFICFLKTAICIEICFSASSLTFSLAFFCNQCIVLLLSV